MAKKVAKTASKNAPSNRQRVADIMLGDTPVVKVQLYKRVNGKLNRLGVVASKKSAAAGEGKLFITTSEGSMMNWSDLSSCNS